MKRFLLDDCKSRMIVKEKIREGGGEGGDLRFIFNRAGARAAPLRAGMQHVHATWSFVGPSGESAHHGQAHGHGQGQGHGHGLFLGGENYFSQCCTYSHSARAETHHGHLFLPHTTQSFSSIKAP
jgi:hypothetical protein